MSKTHFELAVFDSTAECAEVRRDAFSIQTLPLCVPPRPLRCHPLRMTRRGVDKAITPDGLSSLTRPWHFRRMKIKADTQ
jgi:hypothetical protein